MDWGSDASLVPIDQKTLGIFVCDSYRLRCGDLNIELLFCGYFRVIWEFNKVFSRVF